MALSPLPLTIRRTNMGKEVNSSHLLERLSPCWPWLPQRSSFIDLIKPNLAVLDPGHHPAKLLLI